jgi:hypothetical protein
MNRYTYPTFKRPKASFTLHIGDKVKLSKRGLQHILTGTSDNLYGKVMHISDEISVQWDGDKITHSYLASYLEHE